MDLKKYRNKKTGATFVSSFDCSGGDWIVVEESKEQNEDTEKSQQTADDGQKENDQVEEQVDQESKDNQQEQEPEDQEPKTGTDFDTITVKQIKQELDAFGIKYDPRAKKQVLYDLMMQGK